MASKLQATMGSDVVALDSLTPLIGNDIHNGMPLGILIIGRYGDLRFRCYVEAVILGGGGGVSINLS